MTNYGLPLRFKELYIEGDRKGQSGIIFDIKNCLVMKRLYSSKWYQSTGQHDANGKEIFFGDVLIYGDDVMELRYLDDCGMFLFSIYTKAIISHSWIKKCVCIGNIHTPPADLKAAAEKARAEHG